MGKLYITEDITIELHELESWVKERIRDMDTDDIIELAFEHLVEYYKEEPGLLFDYFVDEETGKKYEDA